ncbi:MAG: PilZ domain-containing protein [Gammaproteobacteria bacterium]|nr:PilZ domain-containing protein [Gammaproteobacteria bacterium]
MKKRTQDMRLNPRRRLKIRTTLVHNQVPILNCCTRDLSFSGAYIEIPPSVSMARIGDPVKLIIDVAGRNALILRGRVTRHGSNGAGVSFHKVDLRSNAVILDLMFGQARADDRARPAVPVQVAGGNLPSAQTVGWR